MWNATADEPGRSWRDLTAYGLQLTAILMIGSLLLLLLCVGLAVLTFYLGFIRKDSDGPGIFRWKAQAGFIAFSVLSVIWIWHIWNITQAEPQLSKFIVPYPGAEYTPTYDRFVDDNASWMATVDAPPDVVVNFYLSPANVPGWTVVEENDRALIFRRDGEQLAIFVSNHGQHGSLIVYRLTKKKK